MTSNAVQVSPNAATWKLIGNKIKQRRRTMGLSRTDLADRVDLRSAQVAQIEEGSLVATTTWLKRIAGALGVVDVQQFYGPAIHIVIQQRPETETEVRRLIGLNIYQRRRALSLSRTALADRVNMTARQIETIENGAVSMRAENAPMMCAALGFLDVRQLYSREADR
jgi:ribosome-binding protein aMBF1 (putative translation factor)